MTLIYAGISRCALERQYRSFHKYSINMNDDNSMCVIDVSFKYIQNTSHTSK